MSWRAEIAPGIELREFVPDDAPRLHELVDENREYLRAWLPWVDLTRSTDDVLGFIERSRRQHTDGLGPTAGIWIEGELCGCIGCHPIDWAHRKCSLGYWLTASLQGRGLMTDCCRAMLDYLFDTAGLHRVTIQCGTGNTKSCAIPQRLGFEREGVLRECEWVNDRWIDLVVWSMLEDDWRRLRQKASEAQ